MITTVEACDDVLDAVLPISPFDVRVAVLKAEIHISALTNLDEKSHLDLCRVILRT